MNPNIDYIDIDKDLRSLWLSFKRRWKIGFLLVSGTILLFALAAIKQKPEYIATGKLLFKINRTSILTGIGKELNNFDSLEHNANPMITEIEVLKSFPIAEKALASIKQYDSINSDISAKELLRKLSVEPVVGTDVVVVSFKGHNEKDGAKIVDQLMKTYINNNLVNNSLDISAAQKIVQGQLPKAKHRVEEREKLLQKFKEKHQLIAFEEESKSILIRRDTVQQDIEDIQLQLQEVQSESQFLKQKLGMDLSQAIALRNINQSPQVQEALQNLSRLQSEVIQKQEFFEDDNPIILRLYSQIKSLSDFLESEIQKIPNSSNQQFSIANLQGGDADRTTFQQELIISLAEAERLVPALQKKLAQLQQMKTGYQESLQNLPKIENEYRDLQLKLETAQSNYRSLLKSLEDIRIAEPQNLDNVRVIESAQIQESYRQSWLLLAMGLALGPILAISTMTGFELTDKSVRTIEQLEGIFNYPILGTIPNLDSLSKSFSLTKLVKKSLVQYLPIYHRNLETNQKNSSSLTIFPSSIVKYPAQDLDNSLVIKSFSMLHARLSILLEKRSVKTIVVSSALPQEGKSRIVSNLALNMANLGQKVLIIDANLLEPEQQIIWQVKHDEGLADVILDGKIFDILIHRVSNNLDLLSSGRVSDNPYNIINAQKMKLLIHDAAQKYDCVLIDSTSITGNVDALNLGKMSDGILLVTRLRVLDYSKAKECLNLLEMTNQNVIGIVANGVPR